jgi:hypothetical protein
MKGNWSHVSRTGVEFFIAKVATPFFQVFHREFEGVQYRALYGINFRQGAAKPGFGEFNVVHDSWAVSIQPKWMSNHPYAL